jgi:glutathionylspermidine synthase
MERVATAERPNWQDVAREMGFTFHHSEGQRYWDERAYYRFTLEGVERDIEEPTAELHQMCLGLVDEVVKSEALMDRLAIPSSCATSSPHPGTRGRLPLRRFDFSYDGSGPAKLLEYNADTPTSIYETALFQWRWLEDMMAAGRLPDDADPV